MLKNKEIIKITISLLVFILVLQLSQANIDDLEGQQIEQKLKESGFSDTGPILDPDDDGISSLVDNCPTIYNPSQEDADINGIGDACETADKEADENVERFPPIKTKADYELEKKLLKEEEIEEKPLITRILQAILPKQIEELLGITEKKETPKDEKILKTQGSEEPDQSATTTGPTTTETPAQAQTPTPAQPDQQGTSTTPSTQATTSATTSPTTDPTRSPTPAPTPTPTVTPTPTPTPEPIPTPTPTPSASPSPQSYDTNYKTFFQRLDLITKTITGWFARLFIFG